MPVIRRKHSMRRKLSKFSRRKSKRLRKGKERKYTKRKRAKQKKKSNRRKKEKKSFIFKSIRSSYKNLAQSRAILNKIFINRNINRKMNGG